VALRGARFLINKAHGTRETIIFMSKIWEHRFNKYLPFKVLLTIQKLLGFKYLNKMFVISFSDLNNMILILGKKYGSYILNNITHLFCFQIADLISK